MEEVSKAYKHFVEYWQDMDNLYAEMQNLATIVVYSVATIVTILIIYLGWLYTSTRQSGAQSQTFSPNPQKQRSHHTKHTSEIMDPAEQTSTNVNEQQNKSNDFVSNKSWPSGFPAGQKIPKSCPMSKMYTDISKMSDLIVDGDKENSGTPAESGLRSQPSEDPVDFCDHIQSEYKRSQHRIAVKKIEQDMTDEQKENERDIKRKQLEAIYKLMETQQEKFGVSNINDMQDQVKLYM